MISRRLCLAIACLFFLSGCLMPCGRKPNSPKVSIFGSVWAETKCKAKNVASAAKSKCGFSSKLPRQACEPKRYFSFGYSFKKDTKVVRKNAKLCAHKSMRNLGGRFSKDYKDGFETAYVDIALGASGATPAIPPEKYWKAYFRTNRGRARAQQWFEGYRSGSQHAEATGFTRFNDIASSGEVVATRPGQSHQVMPAGFVAPQQVPPGMLMGPSVPNGMGPMPAGTPMFGPPTAIPYGMQNGMQQSPIGPGVQIPQFAPPRGPRVW